MRLLQFLLRPLSQADRPCPHCGEMYDIACMVASQPHNNGWCVPKKQK